MTLKQKIKTLIQPRHPDEDLRRRELILNILLWFSIVGFAVLNVIRLIDLIKQPQDRGLPIIYTLSILLFFIFLLRLSRKGRIKIAAWLLVVVYALPMLYSFIAWGADLPAALLLAVLIITLSGVLIGSNLVLISTAAINLFLIILTRWQTDGTVVVNGYWRKEPHELGDAIAYTILFLIIAIIAWLFSRGIEKALKRARQSEADLRQERDSLEIKVIEKTKELRQAETEKIGQLYHLAEFGRLSSGIFHDLINPLTAISLNLEQIKDQGKNEILGAKSYLSQAILATHKMEDLIASIKKQIQRESQTSSFSANEEIHQIIQILAYKARRAAVKIIFRPKTEVQLYGEAVKFGQVITNLLANAIEASEIGDRRAKQCTEQQEWPTDKEVEIKLEPTADQVFITISDQGHGISPENVAKIFEPFFSTKNNFTNNNAGGLGLGLSSSKNIIEKCFAGEITVDSHPGDGTKFIISLPLYHAS
ncbi:TPA: hypothetical protein DCZ15_01850 [Candidatus Falkowbacteria bacterium]|nr:MAG: Response regulator receiver sensor signal transduction histidine kinase [Candidatus Falkowbacteria bacterium GW2011_GWF2_43_32]HBA36597.1 hypothetical protein [Candidatus Falkowbacteria bacterium]